MVKQLRRGSQGEAAPVLRLHCHSSALLLQLQLGKHTLTRILNCVLQQDRGAGGLYEEECLPPVPDWSIARQIRAPNITV